MQSRASHVQESGVRLVLRLLHTCDTNGVIREPILAIALQVPIAKALLSVGKTYRTAGKGVSSSLIDPKKEK